MRRQLAVVLLAVPCGLVGCGNARPAPGPRDGRALFSRYCSGCHSLIGNESRHRQGGDLAGYSMSRATLLEFTREMPTRRPLSSVELQSVVDYVSSVQRRGPR